MSFIAQGLYEPPKEEEEVEASPERVASPVIVVAAQNAPAPVPAPVPANGTKPADVKPTDAKPQEPLVAEKPKEETPPFVPNDYLQKAELEPPCDPEGNPTMQDGLMITLERIMQILESTLLKNLTYIMTEK